MNSRQTDNSHIVEKIKLRIDNLPTADPLRVLDLFHGQGRIWNEIIRRTGRNIQVTAIEQKKIAGALYLKGNNKKFRMDYDQYDIIDVDAYGVPFAQLEDIFRRSRTPKVVFVTWIMVGFGQLPYGLLCALGYSRAMIKKIPTIFSLSKGERIKAYLGMSGMRSIKMYHTENHRKNYICLHLR